MMRIRFGTYKFCIKKYERGDLNLGSDYSHLSFEMYQKAFHIMYIPVFPVDRLWVVKDKHTNAIAETNPEIRTALNLKKLKTKNAWWSYSGIFILGIPVILIFIFIFGIIFKQTASDIGKYNTKRERISQTSDKLLKAAIDDTFTLKMYEVIPKRDRSTRIYKYERTSYTNEKLDYIVDYISNDSIGLTLNEAPYKYAFTYTSLKRDCKLSKKDLLESVTEYADLHIYNVIKVEEEGKEPKILAGLFRINDDK